MTQHTLRLSWRILLVFVCGVFLRARAGLAAERLPNIVIIFADDLGYGDVSRFNPDGKVSTPHVDRLAAEGMMFTNAHAPAAWCTPSRYGLLTGQYPWRNKRPYDQGIIAPDRETIATLLKRHGYQTAMIGKWHEGFVGSEATRDYSKPMENGPVDHGFESFFGMHASLDIQPYYFIQDKHAVAAPTETIMASSSDDVTEVQGAFWRAGKAAPGFKHAEVLPTWIDHATKLMRDHAKEQADKPLFLYLALTAPHTPWLPGMTYQGKSHCGPYGDFVQEVDDVAGRVLATLDETGMADNTLVIFTSDNGPCWFSQDVARWNHRAAGPFRGMKSDMWEGGHRMPFVVRWPGHTHAGSKSDSLICFTDMLATFGSVVGETLPADVVHDSFSIRPLLEGASATGRARESLIIEGRVIIKDQWKWIGGKPQMGLHGKYGQDAKVGADARNVLYNLREDPGELKDVSKEHPEIVKELKRALAVEMGK
ncbi:MAG TPA: arylsulfatase [Tepidisphaeraceae bacterium]|nr:arylsulfatase [Tepidisphaeraceae bacterium]